MLRPLRRPAAVLIPVVLLAALTACGGSSSEATDGPSTGSSTDPSSAPSGSAATGLSAVALTGAVGKNITGTWKSALAAPPTTTVTTLVKGTGAAIASGDTVSAYLWIGDGTTQKTAYSDYTNGAAESIMDNSQLSALFVKLLAGATYGSRVAAVTTPSELFGPGTGNAQLGIGATDSLVVVADLVKKAAVSPTPTDDKVHDVAPGTQPKVILKAGKPAGLDWTGVAKPSLTAPVRRVILTKGTGPAVKASDTLTVNYLGEVYQGKSAFDESYTTSPLTDPLSQLIQGWSIGLTGVKVGSRVLLEIPPAYGYGAAGSGSTIPGNATLWFVIDVVKAS